MELILELLPYHAEFGPASWRRLSCLSQRLRRYFAAVARELAVVVHDRPSMLKYSARSQSARVHGFKHGITTLRKMYQDDTEYWHYGRMIWSHRILHARPKSKHTICATIPAGSLTIISWGPPDFERYPDGPTVRLNGVLLTQCTIYRMQSQIKDALRAPVHTV